MYTCTRVQVRRAYTNMCRFVTRLLPHSLAHGRGMVSWNLMSTRHTHVAWALAAALQTRNGLQAEHPGLHSVSMGAWSGALVGEFTRSAMSQYHSMPFPGPHQFMDAPEC